MTTYLITHFPSLYLIAAICFIVSGFSLLNYDKIAQVVMRHISATEDLTTEWSLQVQVAISDVDEGIYKQYQLTQVLTQMDTSFSMFVEQEYKLFTNTIVAIENKVSLNDKSADVQEAKEVSPVMVKELTDVADIIKMKMNFMSFA